MNDIFNRVELLAGREGLERLRQARVIIFGLGGVGSWAAESLARTAIGHITLVDADDVAPTNINRQLPALDSRAAESRHHRAPDSRHQSAMRSRGTPRALYRRNG